MTSITKSGPGRRKLRVYVARTRCWLWRFGTLPYVRVALSSNGDRWLETRRFAGRTLHVDLSRSDAHRMLLVDGPRYVQERKELLRLVGAGATVLEVGANIGYTMLLLADAVGEVGRVICLEPVPENLEELRLNVEANELTNVSILAQAAGDFDGRVRMTAGLNGRVGQAGGDLEVEIRRIDSMVDVAPDLIKVDVEGYELQVLLGATGLLTQGMRPSWWIEMHPQLVESLDELHEVLRILESHDYVIRAYRSNLSSSIALKLVERYFGFPRLERSDRPHLWLRESQEGGRNDSFWLSAVPRA